MLPPQFDDVGLLPSLREEARVVMNVDEQALPSPSRLDLDLDLLDEFWDIPPPTPGGPTHSPFAAEVGLGDDNLGAH